MQTSAIGLQPYAKFRRHGPQWRYHLKFWPISHSLDEMSIFLNSILRDFLFYIINQNQLSPPDPQYRPTVPPPHIKFSNSKDKAGSLDVHLVQFKVIFGNAFIAKYYWGVSILEIIKIKQIFHNPVLPQRSNEICLTT